MQPFWASDDDQMRTLRVPVLGPDRAGWQYPFASLLRTGATLAGGSDWTVSTPNPLLEIEVAVTRVAPDTRDVAPFLPDERLSLDAALRAFTIGSAYVNHLDAETGTIEVGKLADLVVLDRNIRDAGCRTDRRREGAPDVRRGPGGLQRLASVDGRETQWTNGRRLSRSGTSDCARD